LPAARCLSPAACRLTRVEPRAAELSGARPVRYVCGVSLFQPVFEMLEREQVRYVVVGGLAVVLRGFARLTADIDLVIDLSPHEATRAMRALCALGLRPRAPVQAIDFADPIIRASWIQDKGMRVFSLWDPGNPLREVDLFTESPIPFDQLWSRSDLLRVGPMLVRVASTQDLVALKRMAGRPQDLLDIEALEAIALRRHDGK
jgi:hypothetical protein